MVELNGVVDINIAARLLWTDFTPYAIKKKGKTRLTNPIIANQYQSLEKASILIWAIIILLPLVCFIEQPWQSMPRTDSLISVIYLGVIPTGVAWLLRFRILKNNGLIFQSQVSYLIPIFGMILGYIFLKEMITPKVVVSLLAVLVGLYFVKKADIKKNI